MSERPRDDEPILRAVATHALALVVDDTTIGLGTGRAAAAFIAALGTRVREGLHVRIVAAASRRQVILVGEEKLVRGLGERGRIPVEVIPLASGVVTRALARLDLTASLRVDGGGAPLVTENSNLTLDCRPRAPL